MKILAVTLLSLLCFIKNTNGADHVVSHLALDTSILKNSFKKTNFNKLISDIASYGRVEFGPVGYSATITQQYNRYLKLVSIATDSQLVNLTDHFSATVKVYAAAILYARKYQGFDIIYNKLVNDRQLFSLASGCIVESKRIDKWIYEKVNGPAGLFK